MEHFWVISALLSGAIGLMLFAVGSIFTAITALGKRNKLWGWCTLLVWPISLIYCAKYWKETAYSAKMVYSGAILLCITFIILKVGGLFSYIDSIK